LRGMGHGACGVKGIAQPIWGEGVVKGSGGSTAGDCTRPIARLLPPADPLVGSCPKLVRLCVCLRTREKLHDDRSEIWRNPAARGVSKRLQKRTAGDVALRSMNEVGEERLRGGCQVRAAPPSMTRKICIEYPMGKPDEQNWQVGL